MIMKQADFLAQVNAFSLAPPPRHPFDDKWLGVAPFVQLRQEGRASPEVENFIRKMFLPSEARNLSPHAIGYSLLGLRHVLSNANVPEMDWPPAIARAESSTAPLITDVILRRNFNVRPPKALQDLEKQLSMAKPLSCLTEICQKEIQETADLYLKAEANSFLSSLSFLSRKAHHLITSHKPGALDLKAHFQKHTELLGAAVHYARDSWNPKNVTHEEVVQRHAELWALVHYAQNRFRCFWNLYFIHVGISHHDICDPHQWIEDTLEKLRDGRDVRFPDEECAQATCVGGILPALWRHICQAEEVLKYCNPEEVRDLMVQLHQGSFPLAVSTINTLLGVPDIKSGELLESGIDWQKIRALHGDQQYEYNNSHYEWWRSLMKFLNLGRDDHLMDLGSGYGALALYAAFTAPSARVTGVEIVSERHERALRVAKSLKLPNLTLLNQDALRVAISDVSVFILFSPFSPEVLAAMVRRLRKEAKKRPFRIVSVGNSNFFFSSQMDWLTEPYILNHGGVPNVEAMSFVFKTL